MILPKIRKVNRKVIVLILFCMILMVFGIFKSNFLAINKTSVESREVKCVSNKEIEEYFNRKKLLIINFDKDKESIALRKTYPCIGKANISLSFPKNIKANIEGRKGLVRVGTIPEQYRIRALDLLEASPSTQTALLSWKFPEDTGIEFFDVDEDGVVFASGSTDVPLIFTSDENLSIGLNLGESRFQAIKKIYKLLSDLGLQATQAKIDGSKFQMVLPPKVSFFIGNRENTVIADIDKQIASLQLILQKAKIEGIEMEIIDLRFENPVVNISPKKKK